VTKTLILIRHADAEPGRSGLDDVDRSLTEHGRRDAERAGRYLADLNLVPDWIVYSAALRSSETVEKLTSTFAQPPELQQTCKLYMASADDIAHCVRRSPATVDTIAVVGHNPGISAAALSMVRADSNVEILDRINSSYYPAAMAVIGFDLDRWTDISGTSGTLLRFAVPSEM
jgi:phosphohistidine phosphatase